MQPGSDLTDPNPLNTNTLVIYHPDGETTEIKSPDPIDASVQDGRLVVTVKYRLHAIYREEDWVSVNTPPRE